MPSLQTRIKQRTEDTHRIVLAAHPPPSDAWPKMHGEYRYSLPEPFEVDRRDAVLHFMKRTIRKLQMENINVGVQRYKIQGLTCHRPIWPLDLANAPFPTKLYAIKPCWEEFPACIIVTVEDRGTILTLTTDRVKVKLYPTAEGARWMPIDKFLTAWATPHYGGSIHPDLPDEAAQRKWWPMTGKSFRFLDLPKEIRLQILAHALGTEVNLDILQPNKVVFNVSRQVDDEAWEAIVVGREKHFYSEACLSDVLQRPIPPALASTNWLSKVTLKLTLTKFFEFFGWEFNPILQPRSNTPYTVSPAEMLQRSPLIEELTLDIQNPYTDGRHPWRSMQDYTPRSDDRIDWVSVETYFTTYKGHSPCYRTIVNWLLILAFPYIKGIPKVNLRGAVKTTIKKDWARILSIEYKKSIGEQVFDTHSFDYQASLDSLLVIPASELPPRCECPKSCYYNTKYDLHPDWQWELNSMDQSINAFDHDDTFQVQELLDAYNWIKEDTARNMEEYKKVHDHEGDDGRWWRLHA